MLTDEKGVGSPAGLYAASGCDAASPRGEPQAAISREESSVLPDAPPQAKPLPGILLGAAPVSYQTGGGWVSAAMDSDEAQSFTGALIARFRQHMSRRKSSSDFRWKKARRITWT